MSDRRAVDNRKIWLVAHPTSQYVEDVKLEARKANLKIIDSKHRKSIGLEYVCTEPPKLTLKPKKQVQKEAKEAGQAQ